MDSVASLTARVPILDSHCSWGYVDRTIFTGISLDVSILEAGRTRILHVASLYGSGMGDSSLCGIGGCGELEDSTGVHTCGC